MRTIQINKAHLQRAAASEVASGILAQPSVADENLNRLRACSFMRLLPIGQPDEPLGTVRSS